MSYKDYIDTAPTKQKVAYYSLINGYDPNFIYALVDCESGWQPNATNTNSNGSIDYSIFQINDKYHLKQALKMGLDIKDPDQNIIYAFQLMKRAGFAPWKASASCISKKVGNSLPSWVWDNTS